VAPAAESSALSDAAMEAELDKAEAESAANRERA